MVFTNTLVAQKGKKITVLLKGISAVIITGTLFTIECKELILKDCECQSENVSLVSGSEAHIHLSNVAAWFTKNN